MDGSSETTTTFKTTVTDENGKKRSLVWFCTLYLYDFFISTALKFFRCHNLSVSDPECAHCHDIATQGACKVDSTDKTRCINKGGLYCSYDTVLLQHCRIKGKYIQIKLIRCNSSS